jgi:ssRNA-specific RNase YbeY (16S rRNA maturation enzyme)
MKAITTADEETLGEMGQREVKDWLGDECEVVTREKNEVYVRMLHRSSTRELTEEYRNKRREEKKVHRRKKRT